MYVLYLTLLLLGLPAHAAQNSASGDFAFNMDNLVSGDILDSQEVIMLTSQNSNINMTCTLNNSDATNGISFTTNSAGSSFPLTAYFPEDCAEGANILRITGQVPLTAENNATYSQGLTLKIVYGGGKGGGKG